MVVATYSTAAAEGSAVKPDFSLVLGGPLFQVLRRVGLVDEALGLLHRRIIAGVLITWAPLLVLSALDGRLIGDARTMPFLTDVGAYLRFLVVIPLLLAAEVLVHRRMRPLVDEFGARNLVPHHQTPRFEAALGDALRLRNSVIAEVLLLVFVYVGDVFFTVRRYEALGGGGWYASASPGQMLSPAGMWLVFVSLPLVQFLLLRWYFRLFIWAVFLWRMSRLDLDLNALHPDKAGGLGFLSESLSAFAPLSGAQGVMVAGVLADRIFFGGAQVTDFEMEVIGAAVLLVILFVGPLTVFAPRLAHVKRAGLREYGGLAQTYVRGFRSKWFEGRPPTDEPLVGTGDIQSLADLGNSFGGAEAMRIAPIRAMELIYFLAAFLAPILPLALTMMSVNELLARIFELLFAR